MSREKPKGEPYEPTKKEEEWLTEQLKDKQEELVEELGEEQRKKIRNEIKKIKELLEKWKKQQKDYI